MSLICYLRRRLNERSTWILLGAGVTAAAALAWPWSLAMFLVSLVGAVVPDGKIAPTP